MILTEIFYTFSFVLVLIVGIDLVYSNRYVVLGKIFHNRQFQQISKKINLVC